MKRVVLAGALALFAYSGPASAFCRTTTCDALNEECDPDEDGCSTIGLPLEWDSLCLYYGIQKDGSNRRQISADDLAPLVDTAFQTWNDAGCGSGTPPFVAQSIGMVDCAMPEFNCDTGDHNANTVMFRDDAWPYDDAALAITTVTTDVRTGEILDADMELNAVNFGFTTGDAFVNNDLLSVITHEVGHFLGLSHSPVRGSTMFAGYNSHDSSIRELSQDDIDGICDIYPPSNRSLTCTLNIPKSTMCLGGTECPAQTVTRSQTCSFNPGPLGAEGRGAGLMLGLLLALGMVTRRSTRLAVPLARSNRAAPNALL